MMAISGCDTSSSSSSVSEGTTISYLRMISPFDDDVYDDYSFTIDTVNNLIYNEDSLPYGTRLDSLAPVLSPVFSKCVIDDTINLYANDTVYVDFTSEHVLTVTASGDSLSRNYRIWVNVHQVEPDSMEWTYLGGLTSTDITNDHCVATEDGDLYWMIDKGGELMVLQSYNGHGWTTYPTDGITKPISEIDITHAVAHNGEVCMMAGTTLFTSDAGLGWTSKETTSNIEVRHLLFSLNNALYALGESNTILRLNGANWELAAEMPSGFPVAGETVSVGKSPSGIKQVMVGCGIDEMGNYLSDVWSTENGSYWVKLTQKDSLITPRAYASMAHYASGLVLMGGLDSNGEMVDDYFLYSQDYGMTWQEVNDVFLLDSIESELYARRSHSSLVATTDGHIIAIGGTYYPAGTEYIPPRIKSEKKNDMWRGIHYASLPGFKN